MEFIPLSCPRQPHLLSILAGLKLLLHLLLQRSKQLPLLPKHLSRLLKHHLKALPSFSGILSKPLHRKILNASLDPLPAAAKGRDLGPLVEQRLVGGRRGMRRVLDRLAHAEEVAEGHVDGAQRQRLGLGVHVRDLVHQRLVGRALAQDRGQPFRRRLLAGDEALGAEDTRCRIDAARKGVDGQDVRRLAVPRTVLYPV